MSDPNPSDDDALSFLSTHGWLPLILSDHDGLVEAYTTLLSASKTFFALPERSSEKVTYRAAFGALASEEGYSCIPSEKSILTIKTSIYSPDLVHEPARKAWQLTSTLMQDLLAEIAESLKLESDVFAPFTDPCLDLPETMRTPTLLRMFRYDRPLGTEWKVNAEKHKDLGLLSLVVGHSPGLHVLNAATGLWVPIEDDAVLPKGAKRRSGGLTATLLVGETLAFLSRGRFRAGVHGVVCAPPEKQAGVNEDQEGKYRYSIVYTLRPAVAPLWTRNFESEVTGRFPVGQRSEGKSSDELFTTIKNSHYNVNAAPEVRERQRLDQMKSQGEKTKALRGQG